jgi:hypothetical protein
MPTQLRQFSANGSANFPKLEKEVNDWLPANGDSIQPVNSQTGTKEEIGGSIQKHPVRTNACC